MRIAYDEKSNAAYVYLAEDSRLEDARTQEIVSRDVALDFDAQGKPLGIEILSARSTLRKAVLREVARRMFEVK